MASTNQQIESAERLNRNLGLLQPGSGITIDIAMPAGKKGKFRAVFIGYLPKNYVLIQYPDASKLGAFSQYIAPGLSVTVRGLIEGSEGAVVGFVTTVRQTLQTPSRLIVLEFPYKVSFQPLRSNIRIDTDLKTKISVEKEHFQGVISNISISGCKILVHNASSLMMANDKAIDIVLENFNDKGNMKLAGVIRNVKKQSNDISLGIHFPEEIKEQVLKVIEHAIIG